MIPRGWAVPLAFAIAILGGRATEACKQFYDPDRAFVIVESEKAIDHQAPGPATLTGGGVGRSVFAETSCGDHGWVSMKVEAADDRTAPEELGYRIEWISSTFPTYPSSPERTWSGRLTREFADTRDLPPVDVLVRVRAVDRAGNEGPWSAPYSIHHAGFDAEPEILALSAQAALRMCVKGTSRACLRAAKLFEYGVTVPLRKHLARTLYAAGCFLGEPLACFITGDEARGRELYRVRCAQGNVGACRERAKEDMDAVGWVPPTRPLARDPRMKACRAGDKAACDGLAIAIWVFADVAKRPPAEEYRVLCEAGSTRACEYLALARGTKAKRRP